MVLQQWWRLRFFFSFRNATMVVCLLNMIIAMFLLQGFLSSSAYARNKLYSTSSGQLSYVKESEEIRFAMLPLELIKRNLHSKVKYHGDSYTVAMEYWNYKVREIENEVYTGPATIQQKHTKQTAAVDLSKRLQDFRSLNDAASLKALEEWRKRKMERARQRKMEKNGTTTSQA